MFLFFFSREKWEKQVSRRWSTALLPVVRWFWQSIRNSPAISPPLPVNVSRSFLLPIIDSRTIAMVIPLIILLIVDSVRPASSFHFFSLLALRRLFFEFFLQFLICSRGRSRGWLYRKFTLIQSPNIYTVLKYIILYNIKGKKIAISNLLIRGISQIWIFIIIVLSFLHAK